MSQTVLRWRNVSTVNTPAELRKAVAVYELLTARGETPNTAPAEMNDLCVSIETEDNYDYHSGERMGDTIRAIAAWTTPEGTRTKADIGDESVFDTYATLVATANRTPRNWCFGHNLIITCTDDRQVLGTAASNHANTFVRLFVGNKRRTVNINWDHIRTIEVSAH